MLLNSLLATAQDPLLNRFASCHLVVTKTLHEGSSRQQSAIL
jgi:hypothetical protein